MTDFVSLAVQKLWEGFFYTTGAGVALAVGWSAGLGKWITRYVDHMKSHVEKAKEVLVEGPKDD